MAVASRWIRSGVGKRVLDLFVAVPAIVLLAPVTFAVGVAVRVRLGSPVIFRQQRAGAAGRLIDVPKFRSMTNDTDAAGVLLPDADRLSSFGARLRASSLDELPQLWPIIKGEMSIVGPRPLPATYIERYDADQRRRLDARPGLTGWAQVNGRNTTGWRERLAMDVWYVDHASLRLDLRILWLTVRAVAARDGVSAEGHATMPEFTGRE